MISAIVAGEAGSAMFKLVIDRPTGGLLVIPDSNIDSPEDDNIVAKCITQELAELIIREIYEFVRGKSVIVILNPAWMVHHAVEVMTIHVQPVFTKHDVQLAANSANLSTEIHDGEGEIERVVQILWPRKNRTFEAVHLMIASTEPKPVPLSVAWAVAAV
jgi:hypothetical protein